MPIIPPMPGMLIVRAMAIGISRSGKLSVRWTKILGIKAIKFKMKPAIKPGNPIVMLNIVIIPKMNTTIGTKRRAPRRSSVGTTGFKKSTDSPRIIERVSSGNPSKAFKVGSAILNIKPKKREMGMINRMGIVRIM